jgi:hypothetical protein
MQTTGLGPRRQADSEAEWQCRVRGVERGGVASRLARGTRLGEATGAGRDHGSGRRERRSRSADATAPDSQRPPVGASRAAADRLSWRRRRADQPRRGAGAVYRSGLENRRASRSRGFESHPLRQDLITNTASGWLLAGARASGSTPGLTPIRSRVGEMPITVAIACPTAAPFAPADTRSSGVATPLAPRRRSPRDAVAARHTPGAHRARVVHAEAGSVRLDQASTRSRYDSSSVPSRSAAR